MKNVLGKLKFQGHLKKPRKFTNYIECSSHGITPIFRHEIIINISNLIKVTFLRID